MKAAYYEQAGQMSVVDLDKPKIQKQTMRSFASFDRAFAAPTCGHIPPATASKSTRSTTDTKRSASWKKSEKA